MKESKEIRKNKAENISSDDELKSAAIITKPTDAEVAELTGNVYKVKEMCFKASKKNGKIILGKMEVSYPNKNITTIYNEKGGKIEEQNAEQYGFLSTMFYNDNGQPIENRVYLKDGTLQQKGIYKYNERGQIIEMTNRDAEGKLSSKVEHFYNEKGDHLGCNQYGTDEKINRISKIKYDVNGFKIEEIVTDGNGVYTSSNIFKNNHKGHCVEMAMNYADSSLNKLHLFYDSYDSDGNSIYANYVNPKGSLGLENYTYEYDKRGNWIAKIKHYKKNVTNVNFREISYFDDENFISFEKILERINADSNNQAASDLSELKIVEINLTDEIGRASCRERV